MKLNLRRAGIAALLACGLLYTPAAKAAVPIPPGMYAGVDLLFLSPKMSDQGLQDIFFFGELPESAVYDATTDAPLEFAQRLIVGYQGEGGGGARVRWFTFDNNVTFLGGWFNGGGPIVLEGELNIDVDYVDAELTQAGSFFNWTWVGSAGARYARAEISELSINFEDIPLADYLDDTFVHFEGAGPTVSVEGARPILFDGLSIFANARTSILFGNTELASPFYEGFESETFLIDNDFVQVWEIQAGTRYRCPVTDTIDAVGGIFWEAQRWDSDSGFLGDLAFHGLGAQFGFLF
jgi:hypothetical protein